MSDWDEVNRRAAELVTLTMRAADQGAAPLPEDEVAKLGAGDHFGELALIAERERTATVTALTALECLELPVWDFREFVQADSDVAWKLLHYVVNVLLDGGTAAGHRP